ncbi:aminopeptidase [Luteolibacter sp. GHJ8]|uniref:Aminopeptidase n=1 Tax=Luteolibacter rhizosphaerae TaxID=2989719 RepID=A0ABT3G626_9BACT|nr:aminopeptidase [Luteolibacter rhizosphaerae]MCW1915289.1 aminopeptidase [Luteolibacter rhizosphaerae]
MARTLPSLTAVLPALMLLASCQTAKFYTQAAGGQFEILRKSKPIPPIIADPATPPKLKRQLSSVQEIRQFAKDYLTLPGDESYGKYADLGRPYVVWTLYAAPEFSLEPKTWWYPTLGRLDYRGFFRESDTDELVAKLRQEGYDVASGGTTAYSTLGWLHDPVLNTFVDAADVDLAELIFHELTHRRLFRNGDTTFNESLANAVAEVGVKRWLKHHGRFDDLRKYEARLVRRAQFYDRIDSTRAELKTLYDSKLPEGEMRREKARIFLGLQNNFRELRRRWGGRGLENWLKEDVNNAHLVSVITYHHHVPAFHKLLEECGGDLDRFFEEAAKMKLPEPER